MDDKPTESLIKNAIMEVADSEWKDAFGMTANVCEYLGVEYNINDRYMLDNTTFICGVLVAEGFLEHSKDSRNNYNLRKAVAR